MNGEANAARAASAGELRRGRRWRWTLNLILLSAYPLSLGAIGYFDSEHGTAMLPATRAGLIAAASGEIVMFAVIVAAAWGLARPSQEQLRLRWHNGIQPVYLGLGYSIGLRLGLILLLMLLAFIAWALGLDPKQALSGLRPETENVVNADVLVNDPIYFALTLTLVSFVLAGLREELWRAGMLAALEALYPRSFSNRPRLLVAAALVALVFGFGHFNQGIGGIVLTTLLGFGLGAIMIFHRSIWEAVLAHGFFNAGSFAMLYFMAEHRPDLLPSLRTLLVEPGTCRYIG